MLRSPWLSPATPNVITTLFHINKMEHLVGSFWHNYRRHIEATFRQDHSWYLTNQFFFIETTFFVYENYAASFFACLFLMFPCFSLHLQNLWLLQEHYKIQYDIPLILSSMKNFWVENFISIESENHEQLSWKASWKFSSCNTI